MAFTTNTRSQTDGVTTRSTGRIVTDAVTNVATTLTLGFVPRRFTWVNATSTAAFRSDEVREGMAALTSLRTAAVATTPACTQTTLATDGPTINTDGTVLVPAALIPVSSTFFWEALG